MGYVELGSYYNIPKVIFYLLKWDYIPYSLYYWVEVHPGHTGGLWRERA